MINNNKAKPHMERHFQTLIGAILVGLVAWTGLSVTKSLEAVARLDERVLNLTEQVGELKSVISNGYSRQDAARDFTRVHKDLDGLRDRVKYLENNRK